MIAFLLHILQGGMAVISTLEAFFASGPAIRLPVLRRRGAIRLAVRIESAALCGDSLLLLP
jgi:hypothetical protein